MVNKKTIESYRAENKMLREKIKEMDKSHGIELSSQRNEGYQSAKRIYQDSYTPRRRRQVQQSGCLVAIIFYLFCGVAISYAIAEVIK